MSADIIVEQMRRLVGEDYALPFSDPRAVVARAACSMRGNVPIDPAAVVMPGNVDQVQACMRMAHTLGVGVSVLPNAAGNGATFARSDRESMVLDLNRLNDIEEVNTDSGYVLLGPGVSFDQLKMHLQAAGAPYWIDADMNGANSVSGSVADRAFGYTPYGDHLLMQCGLEIVTAAGEVVRTGMGALPGSDTWQLFKYNYGPYLDGLFSRSNFGIISKLGLWLMPAPPAYRPFCVQLPGIAEVGAAVEILRPLKIGMVVPNTVVIADAATDAALLAVSGSAAALTPGAAWQVYGALYGIEANVAITWEMVNSQLAGIEGAQVFTLETPPAQPAWALRARLMQGEPAFRAHADRQRPSLWFSAAAPMEDAAVADMDRIINEMKTATGANISSEFQLTWRTMFLRVSVSIDNSDFEQARAHALAIIERLTDAGYGITHDCPALRPSVADRYTSASMQKLYGAIGQSLDPSGTLGGQPQ